MKHFDTALVIYVYPNYLGEKDHQIYVLIYPLFFFLFPHIKLVSKPVAFAFKVHFILFASFLHGYWPISGPYYLYL